eukprot:CAMPEP_0202016452 /NCGR_PEP_ID=MMETSP0905-20130828/34455_1 /ASSEMBLY_ACC=CAM_ASM_000554 /TAXON_ID=420261 /ORGANISM="Thalassiosira antarctica, Strain CCMP982" /LENGTH=210 /DNA_ID=CAMNT_0048576833 /DNA_START=56 /DNA_END=684 /DNA_ORIENTATION=+
MSSPQEDHPSRSSQRPPRRSRSHPDASDGPDGSAGHQQRSSRSNKPQGHKLTPETKDACLFDFLYRAVFSLVHMALSMVLSPVLSKDRPRTNESSQSLSPNMDDPELAMPENGSVANSCGSSSSYPPILKTDFRRCSSSPETEKKSVRFPAPERARPPLGRIGLTSSSISFSSSSSRSLSSSESESSSRSGGRRERPARLPIRSGSRRTS